MKVGYIMWLILNAKVVPIKKRPVRMDYSEYKFDEMGIDRVLNEAIAAAGLKHRKLIHLGVSLEQL